LGQALARLTAISAGRSLSRRGAVADRAAERLDVNVHPTKARSADEGAVFSLVAGAV
jgi:hypothetical protein